MFKEVGGRWEGGGSRVGEWECGRWEVRGWEWVGRGGECKWWCGSEVVVTVDSVYTRVGYGRELEWG